MSKAFASLMPRAAAGITILRQGESFVGVAAKRFMSAKKTASNSGLKLPATCRQIETIPPQIKDFTAEVASKIVRTNPLLIVDPQVIAKHSQSLYSMISTLQSPDAKQIANALRDLATKECSTIFLQDDIGRLSNQNMRIDLLSPEVIEMLRNKIGIDNNVTSRQETMEAVIESSPNILFFFSILNIAGFGFPNTKEKPLFCFRTVHDQDAHCDSVGSKQSKALVLYGINSTGEVKTFYIDLDRIIEILTPKEIEFLMKPIFYHADLDDFSQNPKKTFAVLTKNFKGKVEVSFDANKNAVAVLGDANDAKKLEELRNRINDFVEEAIIEETILNIGIKTSQALIFNNKLGLHGRQQRVDGKKNDDVVDNGVAALKTESNSERRVLRLLSGSTRMLDPSKSQKR